MAHAQGGSARSLDRLKRTETDRSATLTYWVTTIQKQFVSINSVFFLFALATAIILTIYSSTGELIFDGRNIWWKIVLYQFEIEILRQVIESDATGLLVEYVVTRVGISADLLSHAMGSVTSLLGSSRDRGYQIGSIGISVFSSLLPTVLVAFVLIPRPFDRNVERIPDIEVSTNCIGGRIGRNYGATGQSIIFNASNEKFRLPGTDQAYGLFIRSASRREIFTPKIPQIGAYSTECNSNENVNVIGAKVNNVQGILYDCQPLVKDLATPIEEFNTTFENTSSDTFRIIEDTHEKVDNSSTRAKLRIRMVLAKQLNRVSYFQLECDVQAAETDIVVRMNDKGRMGLSLPPDATFTKKNLTLPPRVVGDSDNKLDRSLENSIGRRGIGVVDKYVTTDLGDWDGLTYWIITAYGVRSALRETFADQDDRRKATEVVHLSSRPSKVEVMRIPIIWVPVLIALVIRLFSLRNTHIFSGNFKQALDWLDWNDDKNSSLSEVLIQKVVQQGDKLFCRFTREGKGSYKLRFSRSDKKDRSGEGREDKLLQKEDIISYRKGQLKFENSYFGYQDRLRHRSGIIESIN